MRQDLVVATRWRIERELARGGTATVYVAEELASGRPVAIKILEPAAAQNKNVRAHFLREGSLMRQVRHDGVVAVIADGVTDDDCPFMVMELLEGDTLDQLRRRRPEARLPFLLALGFGLSILEILAAAHDVEIVHRDVKPMNVLVTSRGKVKLLDFGIAGTTETSCMGRSRTGTGLGTPMFMAPEQITGDRPIDARVDVWGVGTTLYRLISGRHPFEAITLINYVASCMRGAPRLDSVQPDVPPAVADVIARALSFEPARRWANARDMAAALAAASGFDELPSDDNTVALATLPRLVCQPRVAC